MPLRNPPELFNPNSGAKFLMSAHVRKLPATSGHWSARFVIFIPSDADCHDRPADWISERKKLERRGDYIWP
jgi:hypothetical protein